uniref:sn-1-specific diacylglycerol lipase ABHD11 n=1 Tax=Macrostomum lignano TaxID=282301 RepID=A0A1I8JRD6_9PLAT
LNVTMVGVAVEGSHPNLMQILYRTRAALAACTCTMNRSRRSSSWYNAIRGLQVLSLSVSLLSPEELLRLPLTYDFRRVRLAGQDRAKPDGGLAAPAGASCCAGRCSTAPASWSPGREARSGWTAAGLQHLGWAPARLQEESQTAAGQHVFTLSTPDRDYVFSPPTSAAACQQWLNRHRQPAGFVAYSAGLPVLDDPQQLCAWPTPQSPTRAWPRSRRCSSCSGLFGMARNWRSVAKSLARNHSPIICADLRNHGDSPHHQDMSMAAMVGDTYSLPAAAAAVRSLIVVDASPQPSGSKPGWFRRASWS